MYLNEDDLTKTTYKRCRICGKECRATLSKDGVISDVVVCEHIMLHRSELYGSVYYIYLGYKKEYRKRNKKLGHVYKDPKDLRDYYNEEPNDNKGMECR